MESNIGLNIRGRAEYLDEIQGLMILYMIFGHCIEWCQLRDSTADNIMRCLLFYFMPWFFFKSGMFCNNEKSIQEIMKSGYKRLLVPFFRFSFVGYIVNSVIGILNHDYNWVHYVLTPIKEFVISGSLSGNVPLWFLLCLFLVKIVSRIMYGKIDNLVIIVFCMLAGYAWYLGGLRIPLYMGYVFTGLLFYTCGFALNNLQFKSQMLIAAVCTYAFFLFVGVPEVNMRMNSVHQGSYLLWFPACVSGIIIINNLFLRARRMRLLGYIGRKSMTFFVFHWMIIQITYNTSLSLFQVDQGWNLFACSLVICIVLCSYFAYMLDRKSLNFIMGE